MLSHPALSLEWASWPTIITICISLLAVGYWLALPRAIKGIPYNRSSAWKIMGDASEIMKYYRKTGVSSDWFCKQCTKLNSPIVQVFMMRTPVVIVTDYTECEDILSRRFREFDRVDLTGRFSGGLIPNATISMSSHDRFKAQRRLWAGTMSGAFVNEVAVPHIYASAEKLVTLWRIKARLARGHPFQANQGLKHVGMDIIWNFTTGKELGGLQSQIENLSNVENIPVSADKDVAADIPEGSFPELYYAIETIINKLANSLTYLAIIRFYLEKWFSRNTRNAFKVKKDTIDQLLQQAKTAFDGRENEERKPQSAIEQVLGKEVKELEKSGKVVGSDDASMHDEIFLFMIAGYETTSTTLSWAVKFFSDNKTSQTRLRDEIRKALPQSQDGPLPPYQAIISTDIPYLDACLSEILRVSQTAPGVARVCTEDSVVLGKRIPKGTMVVCMYKAETVMHDKWDVDQSLRSSTGKHVAEKKGVWNSKDRSEYRPERWLELNEKGEEVFNPNLGPSLPFAAGPRGCFGKKLAMLEMRIVVVALILNFEFQELPLGLNSYGAKELLTTQPLQCYVRLNAL